MDEQNNNHNEENKCAMCAHGKNMRHGCRYHGSRNWAWIIFKIILCLVILGMVFAGGVAVGFLKSSLGRGMINGSFWSNENEGYGMMGIRNGMMSGVFGNQSYLNGENGKGTTKVFGTVSSINGNKIIITNNGGENQSIISNSSTVIQLSRQEVPLASLKTGQTITAIGTIDANKDLTAKFILVSEIK